MFSLQNDRKPFLYFFLVALFIHLCVMAVRFRGIHERTPIARQAPIKVEILQVAEAMQRLAQSNHKKQIVQSEDSESKTKPKDAFLSDKDRSFDRQTLAKKVDIFNKAGKGDGTVTQKGDKAEPQAKKKEIKDMKLSDLGLPAETMAKPERAPASVSEKGLKNGDPTSNGLSATNDYVQEVGLGDFTHLNTVEFKFYGFYHRIRQKLEQYWGRSIQEKAHALFRSGRRLPASEDLITSLRITMNEKGEIVGIKILGTSGVKELDDAAIESFNQAGPFPNPPRELLVNGKATIEWGFVVQS